MVARAPSVPLSLAGPLAQDRSASRIAPDRREATEVSPENAVFEHHARRCLDSASATCLGRAQLHRRESHRGRRRFFGQTRDGRYCRARYYHPTLSRFISVDPIGFAAGDPTLYAYVGNSPPHFVDPLGFDRRLSQADILLGSGYANEAAGLDRELGFLESGLDPNNPQIAGLGLGAAGLGRGFRPPAGTRQRPTGIPETWRVRSTAGEGGVFVLRPNESTSRCASHARRPQQPVSEFAGTVCALATSRSSPRCQWQSRLAQ
jgi:RHS repeat-associated protein